MVEDDELERAADAARKLLADGGHSCATSAEELRMWFRADTSLPDIGLEDVLRNTFLVAHELVEIAEVKRMGLALTKDVILKNLEKVDTAHLIAARLELELAIAGGDTDHVRARLRDVEGWSFDPNVQPEMRQKYGKLFREIAGVLQSMESDADS